METLSEMYKNLFPGVLPAYWFYALLGLLAHAVMKLKNIQWANFSIKILLEDFLIVWFSSLLSIAICFGCLPQIVKSFSALDAVLIGYSASSIFKQLFKDRMSTLGLKDEETENKNGNAK